MVGCVHVAAIRSLIKPLAGKSFAFGGAVSFVEPNSLRIGSGALEREGGPDTWALGPDG